MSVEAATDQRRLAATTAMALVAGGVALLGAAAAFTHLAALDNVFVMGVAASYLFACGIIVARVRAHHPYAQFGLANTLTLTRLVATCLCTGYALECMSASDDISRPLAWSFFALASGAVILDACDGIAARRLNTASAFGARFDMEVDAWQIMVLAVAGFALGKAGAWILMSGGLRYFFVAAGWVWPRLARPLAYSHRRKIVAAVQTTALTALLAPSLVPPLSTYVAALALGLLVYSFAVDVIALGSAT